MGAYADHDIPIIVRGEGCYVYDDNGKRYLDGLSALFCVNAGHGRTELGEAAAKQAAELGFYTNWSYAHPRSIELAAKIAELAPGDLNRVFFTSGGGESVESAWKLAKAYHKRTGNPLKTKVDRARHRLPRHAPRRARDHRHHQPAHGVRAACPGHPPRAEHQHLPRPRSRDPLWMADEIEEIIEFEGPETVAAVILEPVQNAGGCFTPPEGYFQRVREICDRHDVLLISDEVICSWGRLGYYFGHERYGYSPDIVTTAKGITSAYARDGRSDRDRQGRRAVHAGRRGLQPRHHLRRPPDERGGRAREHRDLRARGPLRPRARERAGEFRAMLEGLRDLPIVGDVRGAGYFHAIELVKDKETQRDASTTRSPSGCCAASSRTRSTTQGLICRADDRGDPVIQLSPPLIADPEQFDEIDGILRSVLTEAWDKIV